MQDDSPRVRRHKLDRVGRRRARALRCVVIAAEGRAFCAGHDLKQMRATPDETYAYAGGVMARNMMAEDAGEGIDAFIEKRPPAWRHR